MNIKKHWLLFVMDMENRKLLEYDSYRNRMTNPAKLDPHSPLYIYLSVVQKLRSVLLKYEEVCRKTRKLVFLRLSLRRKNEKD